MPYKAPFYTLWPTSLFSCFRSYVEMVLSIEHEWIKCGLFTSGNKLTISFFWSRATKIIKLQNEVLTIELNQKFAVGASPYSDGSILTSGQDVVGIDVEWSDCSSVSVGNLPDDLLWGSIERSDETVSPAGDDRVVI